MLQDAFKLFASQAAHIPGFKPVSKNEVNDITELANGYCDADEKGDEFGRNKYISALMIRYWYMVIYMYDHRPSVFKRYEPEEFVSWLHEALEKGLQYRRWRDPENKLYGDKNGPEKVFNQCITSTVARWTKHCNQLKRRLTYTSESLDDMFTTEDGNTETTLDRYFSDTPSYTNSCEDIINQYIEKDEVISALILDGIMNQDSYNVKCTSKQYIDEDSGEQDEITSYSYEFSLRKLTKHLLSIDNKFIDYFINTYDVDMSKLIAATNKIKEVSKPTLHKFINNTIKDVASHKEMFGLC